MKIKIVLGFTFACACMLSACGVDTTGDYNQRQQDRDREAQRLVDNQNKQIAGVYHGETATADFFMTLASEKINSGTSTSPSATLAGLFVISPKVASLNERPQLAFPFANGQYDPGSTGSKNPGGTFTIPMEQGADNIARMDNMTCDVAADRSFSCNWSVIADFNFILTPSNQQELNALSKKPKTPYYYSGSGVFDGDSITATIEIENGYITQDASQIPQTTILGQMSLTEPGVDTPTLTQFKNGTYSPKTGELVFDLDDDTGGRLNCTILSKGVTLKCTRNYKKTETFTVIRAVKK